MEHVGNFHQGMVGGYGKRVGGNHGKMGCQGGEWSPLWDGHGLLACPSPEGGLVLGPLLAWRLLAFLPVLAMGA